MNKLQVIGLGYIGLPTAILTSTNGISTIGVDINEVYLKEINNEGFFTNEPNLDFLLKSALRQKMFITSNTPMSSDIHLIVVPTPITDKLDPDLSFLNKAIKQIAPFLKQSDLIIIESTCPVGTTNILFDLVNELRPDLAGSIFMAYCPERVLPGNILYELENNDRVVGGVNPESSQKAQDFYKKFVKGSIYKTDAKTAELCKLTENASRDSQIAFANEISIICDESGIDPWELIRLANKHPRVNILNPGIGVGGHCIAVDPWFLVSGFPKQTKIIKKVREVNLNKTTWCLNKIQKIADDFILNYNREPIIACMGLSYKPDVNDLRESPALQISRNIYEKYKNTIIVEPNISEHELFHLSSIKDVIEKANIIVWLVSHKEFKNLKIKKETIQLDFIGLNSKHNK